MAKSIVLVFEGKQNVTQVLDAINASGAKFAQQMDKNMDSAHKSVFSKAAKLEAGFRAIQDVMKYSIAGFAAYSAALTKIAIDTAKFEAAISQVAAVSGASAEELNSLKEAALQAGLSTKYSATQSADALTMLAQAGFSASQSIAMLGPTLTFAQAAGATLEQATTIMTTTMKQFNMNASDAGHIADVFAVALAQSNLTIDSLTESMKYAGTAGAGLGWSLEETTAAVAQFVDLGLEGSQAGTNFRMSMSQLNVESKKGAEVLKSYGLVYKDINPQLNSFGEILSKLGTKFITVDDATELFGVRGGANMANIINKQAALKQSAKELGFQYY